MERVNYPKEVDVSVYTGKAGTPFQIKLDGIYQIVYGNKTAVLPNNASLTVTKNGSSYTVNDGWGTTYTGGTLRIEELKTGQKVASFTANTHVRRGATDSETSYEVAKKGTSAEYLDTFKNNSGETWYRVKTANYTGWVKNTTTLVIETKSLSLFTVNGKKYRGGFTLNGADGKVINRLDMEDYLKGVVPNEMPASWANNGGYEALKAQAISARSYAANSMQLSNTPASQVYGGYSSEDSRSNKAVEETAGLLVKQNGKPVQTFYHSTSGGRTANVGDVWTYPHSYLLSVEDKFEHTTAPAWLQNWNYTISTSTLLSQFGVDKNAELYEFIAHPKGANGEIGSVTIKTSAGEVTKSGNENDIRRLFPTGDEKYYGYLLSNWFTATVNQQIKNLFVQQTAGPVKLAAVKGQKVRTTGGTITLSSDNAKVQTSSGLVSTQAVESVTLKGKGWGHRIGMSQYGAYAYSKQGWTAEQILTHYFSNTTVSK